MYILHAAVTLGLAEVSELSSWINKQVSHTLFFIQYFLFNANSFSTQCVMVPHTFTNSEQCSISCISNIARCQKKLICFIKILILWKSWSGRCWHTFKLKEYTGSVAQLKQVFCTKVKLNTLVMLNKWLDSYMWLKTQYLSRYCHLVDTQCIIIIIILTFFIRFNAKALHFLTSCW